MKVLVAVKRVAESTFPIRIKADNRGVDITHSKMIMNPFDEIAVEEAIRLKEQQKINEVIVVSIGNTATQETLRSALAMGADRGILIETEASLFPLPIAHVLKTVVLKESIQLVIMGKQAVDDDNNQTGQILAGLLNWSQGTFASKVILEANTARVTREIDGGLETLLLKLPAVITTDLRLNQPRYLSLPNIVQAKKKPIEVIPLTALSIDPTVPCTIQRVDVAVRQRRQLKVSSVAELVNQLRQKERVIS